MAYQNKTEEIEEATRQAQKAQEAVQQAASSDPTDIRLAHEQLEQAESALENCLSPRGSNAPENSAYLQAKQQVKQAQHNLVTQKSKQHKPLQ